MALTIPSLILLSIFLTKSHSQTITHTPNFTTYSFPSFHSITNTTNLIALNNATFDDNHGALQLTPDTNNIPYLLNTAGRVFLPTPFTLWTLQPNSTIPTVASFNTSFALNIYRLQNATPGEGMAFLISPSIAPAPDGSDGGFLGLTNAGTDGDLNNQIVAVELDTVKQDFDPNDNHIGLDINSVRSNKTADLTGAGIVISPATENGTDYTLWIDYDGRNLVLSAFMDLRGNPKPANAVLTAPLNISKFVARQSYFGFAASTGSTYELNCVLSWNLTVEILDPTGQSGEAFATWKIAVIASSAAVLLLLIVIGVAYWMYVKKRRNVWVDPTVIVAEHLRSLPGTPREFSFKELKKATNNFDEKRKLGEGGFGVVYKGILPAGEEPSEIAVKKFSRDSSGMDDFLKELTIINRLRHKHLVRLVGWCYKNAKLLLVYEYMPNGSLDQHLFAGPDKPILSWERRYHIVEGVASALHYLHNEYDQKVVHRDLKASNIMLDGTFNARLGDFGLARAIDTDKTSYAEIDLGGVPGTLGYIAPECFHTGRATRDSDVFGFGAVVLELVCGRRPRCDVEGFQFLVDWVWRNYREGRILDVVDPRLNGDFVPEDAKRLLLLGLACSHPIPCERPKTQAIVQIISRSVPPPEVPPFKPPFMWPAGPMDDDDGGETTRSSVTSSSLYRVSSMWTPRHVSNGGVRLAPNDVEMA